LARLDNRNRHIIRLQGAKMPSLILIFQRSHGFCEVAEPSGYIPYIMNFKLDK